MRTARPAGATKAVPLQPERVHLVAVRRAGLVHADHRCAHRDRMMSATVLDLLRSLVTRKAKQHTTRSQAADGRQMITSAQR